MLSTLRCCRLWDVDGSEILWTLSDSCEMESSVRWGAFCEMCGNIFAGGMAPQYVDKNGKTLNMGQFVTGMNNGQFINVDPRGANPT